MDHNFKIRDIIPFVRPELEKKISEYGKAVKVKKGDQILVEGQYIRFIPIVIDGLIKVVTPSAEKEFLIYYIQHGESCIMSFSAALNDQKSEIVARAEQDSNILLLPSTKVMEWVKDYPEFNSLFYRQYHKRYLDLLGTIDQLVNERLDERILSYLKEKVKLTRTNPIKVSHRIIAKELGTSREVVTRIIKKLDNSGKVRQHESSIEVL